MNSLEMLGTTSMSPESPPSSNGWQAKQQFSPLDLLLQACAHRVPGAPGRGGLPS